MKRRTFIKISSIATVASVTPWVVGCTTGSEWTGVLAYPQTLGKFCSNDELMAIGQAYFEAHPHERDQSVLEEIILGDHVPSSAETLKQHLENQVEIEFSGNDLSIVNGWVLSRTEARQIALYTLLNS